MANGLNGCAESQLAVSGRLPALEAPVESPTVPVGKPINNTAVFLLPWQAEDDCQTSTACSECANKLDFAERGALGELCIAGACVAAGYLG
jgi:hypothetical protein